MIDVPVIYRSRTITLSGCSFVSELAAFLRLGQSNPYFIFNVGYLLVKRMRLIQLSRTKLAEFELKFLQYLRFHLGVFVQRSDTIIMVRTLHFDHQAVARNEQINFIELVDQRL